MNQETLTSGSPEDVINCLISEGEATMDDLHIALINAFRTIAALQAEIKHAKARLSAINAPLDV